MKLTLGQAAKQSKFSKATLSRAIKSGALSATKLDDGSYSVDPAELQRWVDNNAHRNSSVARLATEAAEAETALRNSGLDSQVNLLRERLEDMRRALADKDAVIADVRQDRDHWREQAERATRLIPPATILAPGTAAEGPRSLWRWFGRRSA